MGALCGGGAPHIPGSEGTGGAGEGWGRPRAAAAWGGRQKKPNIPKSPRVRVRQLARGA